MPVKFGKRGNASAGSSQAGHKISLQRAVAGAQDRSVTLQGSIFVGLTGLALFWWWLGMPLPQLMNEPSEKKVTVPTFSEIAGQADEKPFGVRPAKNNHHIQILMGTATRIELLYDQYSGEPCRAEYRQELAYTFNTYAGLAKHYDVGTTPEKMSEPTKIVYDTAKSSLKFDLLTYQELPDWLRGQFDESKYGKVTARARRYLNSCK